MELSGTHRFDASAQQVWDALQDPEVLARTLPGCDRLTAVAATTWEAIVKVGVGSIRGTYRGTVELSDLEPPHAWRMRVRGAGAPGTVDADVAIRLEPLEPSGVELHWRSEAVVGGMIGGVGQRMLAAAARRTAEQFFRAVEDDLVAAPSTPSDSEASATRPDSASTPSGAERQPDLAGQVDVGARADDGARAGDDDVAGGLEEAEVRLGRHFKASARRPAATASAHGPADEQRARTVLAALVGGALALAGVLVGKRLSSRPRTRR